MRIRLAAGLLPILLVAAGPAAADRATDERLTRIEQRLARAEDNQVLMEMLRRLDALELEVRQLRGEAESNRHELTELKERLRNLYLDMDRRLQPFETGARTEVPRPPAATVAPQPAPAPAPTATAPAAPPAVPAQMAPPAPPTAAETEAYRRAFAQLRDGRYREAVAAFTQFLEGYPNSGYASNAQYWLGEAHYVSRDFRTALDEFRKVTDRFPQSNKAPDALLKLGFTQYELGEHAEARKTLTEVISRYPGTTVARLAEQRLRRMGEAGQ